MIRRHVDEASVATLVENLIVAVQREYEEKLSFAKRLHRLNTECGFMYGEVPARGALWKVSTARRAPLCASATPPA